MIGIHQSMESSSDSEDENFSSEENPESEDEDTDEVLEDFESEESLIKEGDKIPEITNNIGRMALKKEAMNEQKINLTIESPWIIYDFIKEGVHYCCVDILILTIGRDKFIPKCMPSGKAVSVGIIVPTFLFQYDRLKQFN